MTDTAKTSSERPTVREARLRSSAAMFAERWRDRGSERGESQKFWLELLSDVCGAETPGDLIEFEETVKLDAAHGFIDGYIPDTKVLIEQKGRDADLDALIPQSDGSFLTPYQQAVRYIIGLPVSRHPRWVMTCNFREFRIYDMERPGAPHETILLEELERDYWRLGFLIKPDDSHIRREVAVSLKAGELVGKIYDALIDGYIDPGSPEAQRSINVLCVRLVFCLYAEDAGILAERGAIGRWLGHFRERGARGALIKLFKVLSTPIASRDPYLDPELAAFPYVNGGLFEEMQIEIPHIGPTLLDLLIDQAEHGFNWSEISPTIFGAVFESTLNPETRRAGGMHYTSIENIHKLIDPLFLDDLRTELELAMDETSPVERAKKLHAFQDHLASLGFLDPACGSGNFLTETYISLRRLENEAIAALDAIDPDRDRASVKVSIGQFWGIEINDFAASVARTALWIAELQMRMETIAFHDLANGFLPLRSYSNIVCGNALEMKWDEAVPRENINFVMGNPPFSGARYMSERQKHELFGIFVNLKGAGNLDYVSCWFKKAFSYMRGTDIRTAFVATNSITQGEQPAILFRPMFDNGVYFDFAHTTFRWNSESTEMAHVHCVIIGFSEDKPGNRSHDRRKVIYTDGRPREAKNINGYLVDAPNIFVESRSAPICAVPLMGIGSKPIDGGSYLFTEDEMEVFVKKEPKAKKYFRPWYGAEEFINRRPRWCLWLGECAPHELRSMPECLKRVEAVRRYRLASKSPGTRAIADTPTRFHVENMPTGHFIVVPETSSERRKYVPMGFMNGSSLCSNLVRIVPDATLYHFGVLTSNIHMAWMRTVCGRLRTDYRYSIGVVYNNFIWPSPTDRQRAKIEQTARAILDARDAYPDSSFADLYDDTVMPDGLRRAHRDNDVAVMQAYGFPTRGKSLMTEADCVAALLNMYQERMDRDAEAVKRRSGVADLFRRS